MTLYIAVRIVHVTSAFGLFALLGVELASMSLLARAVTAADVRRTVVVIDRSQRFLAPVLLGLLIPGLYMGWQWGYPWWIRLAVIGFVVAGGLGGGITARRLRKLLEVVKETPTPLTLEQSALAHDPMLHWSLWMRVALACSIAALMLTKPPLLTAVPIVVVLLAIGALVGRKA